MVAMPAKAVMADPFDPLDKDRPVWRYMDFAKFADLLQTECLFFSRADRFDDPFEGAYPASAAQVMEEGIRLDGAQKGVKQVEIERRVEMVLTNFRTMAKLKNQWTYVSCWHTNQCESAAMWKLYSQSKDAVAIRSTYGRLAECLPETATIGPVGYGDYDSLLVERVENGFRFGAIFTKRASFRHEEEVRAVVEELPLKSRVTGELRVQTEGVADSTTSGDDWFSDYAIPNPKGGLTVKVELRKLVLQVYVAPQSAPWFLEVVKRMTDVAGLPTPVRSRLEDIPT
jgi:hypothetical protein